MNDIDIQEVLRQIDEIIDQHPYALVFLKWTCPGCGERVMANEPNSYAGGGYVHEQKADGALCGSSYSGTRYGFTLIIMNSAEDRDVFLRSLQASGESQPNHTQS